MNLLILGATGPTGRHLLDHALRHGDQVSVLARNPAALQDHQDRITIHKGNATDADQIAAAASGQDAIISALGRGNQLRADNLFTDAASAVVAAAQQANVQRLVWLSSFGVGDTYADATVLQKLAYRTFLRNIYANKLQSEKTIRSSDLQWTIVYPTTLTNGESRTYRSDDRLPMRGWPTISRIDVAEFLHRAAHDPSWNHRDAVLTS